MVHNEGPPWNPFNITATLLFTMKARDTRIASSQDKYIHSYIFSMIILYAWHFYNDQAYSCPRAMSSLGIIDDPLRVLLKPLERSSNMVSRSVRALRELNGVPIMQESQASQKSKLSQCWLLRSHYQELGSISYRSGDKNSNVACNYICIFVTIYFICLYCEMV